MWGCIEIWFRYDPFGRRIGVGEFTGTSATRIIFDGDNISYYGTEVSGVHFTHGPGVDDPLFMDPVSTNAFCNGEDDYFFVTHGGRLFDFQNANGDDCTDQSTWGPVFYNWGRHSGATAASRSFGLERSADDAPTWAPVSYFRNRYYSAQTGKFSQEDPIGFAGGINLYNYAGNNPASYTDPFGLCLPWPQCALAAGEVGAAAGTAVGAGIGFFGGGVGALPGAGAGNRIGFAIAAGGATLGAIYLAINHKKSVARVNTQLGLANEHLGRISEMPPDDDDPDFVRDMLKHAEKALNIARKHLTKVKGKTQVELWRKIQSIQGAVDKIRGGI